MSGQKVATLNRILFMECLIWRRYGKHLFDVKDSLNAGRNKIEIKVTTTMVNYCKYLCKTKPEVMNPRVNFWISKLDLSSGVLIGPVKLC